ncbi:MAG TPA: arginine--tRNA ligase, partial [Pirellulaceae bacterium]|nr:arginine--tRNA ligase [Pirellulaceae bacterium]
MTVLLEIRERFRQAMATLCDDPEEFIGLVGPAQDARFGDYQANVAMPLAKRVGKPPRVIAQEIVNHLRIDDLCHPPEIAGPGFINVRLQDDWISARLQTALADPRLGVAVVPDPQTYVVDFSSPNVAKPMHVGHIRSTVIGDALAKILRFAGHRVITDNHLGDWGTQFGMIIFGFKHLRDEAAYRQDPIQHLSYLYRQVRQAIDWQQAARRENSEAPAQNDQVALQLAERFPEIEREVLKETAKLHAGDEENLALWREFLPACQADIRRIYQRLQIDFDFALGESFYHDRLPTVVSDFRQRGLAVESEGALCLFLDGFSTPMIIQKKDGAFLYSTSDLATIEYRMREWHPQVILYVVDHRQHEHFEKLFAAARAWGYDQVDLRHISFGTVLGEDGRPFKT